MLCSNLFCVPFILLLLHFPDLSFLLSSKIAMSKRTKVNRNYNAFRKEALEFSEIRG